MQQIWIIKKDGTPTYVYPFDMQEGDRFATPEEVEVLVNGPPLTTEELLIAFTTAIQEHMDSFARFRGYDNILSAASYSVSTVPKFRTEGQYAAEIRDATWVAANQILADVEAGKRPVPTIDEVLLELPLLKWPT